MTGWKAPGPGRPPRVAPEVIYYIRANPRRKAASLAAQLRVSESYVYKIRQGTRRQEAA